MSLSRHSTQCSRQTPAVPVRCPSSSMRPARRRAARIHRVAATDGEQQPPSSSSTSAAQQSPSSSSDLGFKAFVSEDEWRKIDEKVNKYPLQRTFSAIGTGGADYRSSMLAAVESVLGPVHQECISDRPSSNGKYVSVRIGPVWVQTADQVIEVFKNIREDARTKWYI